MQHPISIQYGATTITDTDTNNSTPPSPPTRSPGRPSTGTSGRGYFVIGIALREPANQLPQPSGASLFHPPSKRSMSLNPCIHTVLQRSLRPLLSDPIWLACSSCQPLASLGNYYWYVPIPVPSPPFNVVLCPGKKICILAEFLLYRRGILVSETREKNKRPGLASRKPQAKARDLCRHSSIHNLPPKPRSPRVSHPGDHPSIHPPILCLFSSSQVSDKVVGQSVKPYRCSRTHRRCNNTSLLQPPFRRPEKICEETTPKTRYNFGHAPWGVQSTSKSSSFNFPITPVDLDTLRESFAKFGCFGVGGQLLNECVIEAPHDAEQEAHLNIGLFNSMTCPTKTNLKAT